MADVRQTLSTQPEQQQYVGVLVDTRAAHKCIKVQPTEKGLAALTGKAKHTRTRHASLALHILGTGGPVPLP